METEEFFATARERYKIKIRKDKGFKQELWTKDPIFQEWRFCNVHREDDRTTVWFRENIRDHLPIDRALEGTLIFRWFNRTEVGEKIKDLILADKWDGQGAFERLQFTSPIVTGAYMLKTPEYYNKLEGVLLAIDRALPELPAITSLILDEEPQNRSLQDAWTQVIELDHIGPFTGYEIITDVRWTPLLNQAVDIDTWANPGPGCARGLGWLTGKKYKRHKLSDREKMFDLMRTLLALSRHEGNWPHEYRSWEMREVEHWLCEFDKYKRAQQGERLKRRYQ